MRFSKGRKDGRKNSGCNLCVKLSFTIGHTNNCTTDTDYFNIVNNPHCVDTFVQVRGQASICYAELDLGKCIYTKCKQSRDSMWILPRDRICWFRSDSEIDMASLLCRLCRAINACCVSIYYCYSEKIIRASYNMFNIKRNNRMPWKMMHSILRSSFARKPEHFLSFQ
jgi:hypothetical protein